MPITKRLSERINDETYKALVSQGIKGNEALILIYQEETGASTFKTFIQWKNEGMIVKKGSEGFPVFSRSIGKIKEEQGKESTETENRLFRTAYLFNEFQVEPLKVREPA